MALLAPPEWTEWMGETRQTSFYSAWDGYYLAECPHGDWTVWDAFQLIPLCSCDEAA